MKTFSPSPGSTSGKPAPHGRTVVIGEGRFPRVFVDAERLPLSEREREALSEAGLFDDRPAVAAACYEHAAEIVDFAKARLGRSRRTV